jgi:hypothetical protein
VSEQVLPSLYLSVCVEDSHTRLQVNAMAEKYFEKHDEKLKDAIKDKFDGMFAKGLRGCLYDIAGYTAKSVHRAFKGMGTDEEMLARVMTISRRKQLMACSEKYHVKYEKTLLDAIDGEVDKDKAFGVRAGRLCGKGGRDRAGRPD